MLRLVLFIAWVICFAGMAIEAAGIDDWPFSIPNHNTPQKLREAWLSFHETDLCQEVDALFVFNRSGMEVWIRIEKDKNQRKFLRLFESLKNSHQVEFYTTRSPVQNKEHDKEDPPPSLWQNYELRSNLGERISFDLSRLTLEDRHQLDPPLVDSFLRQRLMIYAEQTLNWNKRMEQYALDLAALARVAYDPGISPEQKSRAIAVCADHAQNLEKYVGKLAANLAQALPMSEKKKRSPSRPETADNADRDPLERAKQISAATHEVSRRVYRFIHPEHYTVELDELRNPSLLESLWELRGMVSDFEKSLPQHTRK
jgi:hypothetical protein